jgi:hypothetical protein
MRYNYDLDNIPDTGPLTEVAKATSPSVGTMRK